MTQIFPAWRQRLVKSLHLNRSQPQSRYYQVATIDKQGLPRNRTMVFRGFEEGSDNLLSITDRRSDKVAEWLAQENKAFELCWYFSKSREQYRIAGKVELLFTTDLISGAKDQMECRELIETWSGLSEKAQEAFDLQAPKTPFSESTDSESRHGNDTNKLSTKIRNTNINKAEVIRNISENFVLVSFIANSVDYLNLKSSPHERLLSDKSQSWTEKKVFA
jgi:PPOX class probable FMN-dependent enzyme